MGNINLNYYTYLWGVCVAGLNKTAEKENELKGLF